MRQYAQLCVPIFTITGGIASASGFLIAAGNDRLVQFAIAYYVIGLVAMVAFSFFMKRLHGHDRHTLMMHFIFSLFAAFFWWAMWGIGVEDWLRARNPPKLNGNHA